MHFFTYLLQIRKSRLFMQSSTLLFSSSLLAFCDLFNLNMNLYVSLHYYSSVTFVLIKYFYNNLIPFFAFRFSAIVPFLYLFLICILYACIFSALAQSAFVRSSRLVCSFQRKSPVANFIFLPSQCFCFYF